MCAVSPSRWRQLLCACFQQWIVRLGSQLGRRLLQPFNGVQGFPGLLLLGLQLAQAFPCCLGDRLVASLACQLEQPGHAGHPLRSCLPDLEVRGRRIGAGGLPQDGACDFAAMVDDWSALSVDLNSLNRSLGQEDPYPFVLSGPVSALSSTRKYAVLLAAEW